MDIKVPQIGESITEVTIDKWLIKEGDVVERDRAIAVIESDKATMELPAEAGGTLTKILKKAGDTAKVGEVIATIDTTATGKPARSEPKVEPKAEPKAESKPTPAPKPKAAEKTSVETPERRVDSLPVTLPSEPQKPERAPEGNGVADAKPAPSASPAVAAETGREEEVIHMTRLRKTVARRLVEAQRNAALLTTFNEIDMSAVMEFGNNSAKRFSRSTRPSSASCRSS